MHTKSTAPSTSTFKPRVRRLGPGRYLVESASRPGRGHTTTATSCSCTGFSYRKTCRHTRLVQAIERPMAAWYGQATTPTDAARDNATAAAEDRLARLYRALADSHPQSDEYATLLHQVDTAERQVAALSYTAMRAA